MKIFSINEMIEAEKAADQQGHSYRQMMEMAGRATAEALIARQDVVGKAIFVLVGRGNNGGDALVAARHLHHAGGNVVVYVTHSRSDEDENLVRVQALDLPIFYGEQDLQHHALRLRLSAADIIVDGLFGTGLSRPISGDSAKLLRQIKAGIDERIELLANAHHAQMRLADTITMTTINNTLPAPSPPRPYIVAIDCPSGLHCDTGLVDPLTLSAHLTVTFAGPKHGHFLFPGATICGELVVADIGIEPHHTAEINTELVTPEIARGLLPDRPIDGHKGTFGRLLIAAGSEEYRGAPLLAAKGAFRAGAGLVSLALPEVVRETAVAQLPEAIYPPITAYKILDHTAEQELFPHINRYKAVLLGPGIGQAESFVMSFLTQLSQEQDAPTPAVVLDADALNVLANRDDWPHLMQGNMILTPHPGEMARLMGMPLIEMRGMNRLIMTQVRAQEWGCIVVFKGAYTVIAAPDGRCRVLPFCNPILGTAGSGDVLAGVITALLGQGVAPFDAAVLGGYLHGLAGQLASQTWGDSGLLAREIADYIPLARKRLQS